MAFWTYILLCADGRYYTGHTDNLEHRIGQHQSGLIEGFTSSRLPVRLMLGAISMGVSTSLDTNGIGMMARQVRGEE